MDDDLTELAAATENLRRAQETYDRLLSAALRGPRTNTAVGHAAGLTKQGVSYRRGRLDPPYIPPDPDRRHRSKRHEQTA